MSETCSVLDQNKLEKQCILLAFIIRIKLCKQLTRNLDEAVN